MRNMSASVSVTAIIGLNPWNDRATVVAVIEASSSGMIEAEVMSSINISKTNITPEIGALNIAATAAPAPQQSSSVMFL